MLTPLEEIYTKDFVRFPVNVSILEAAQAMTEKKIGAVLVTENKKVCGVFTERDILTKVVPLQLDTRTCTISTVMTRNLITIPLEIKPTVALEIMFKKNIRHLPVTNDKGNIVGIVSMRDLLRYVVLGLVQLNRQMQEELDQLRFLNL